MLQSILGQKFEQKARLQKSLGRVAAPQCVMNETLSKIVLDHLFNEICQTAIYNYLSKLQRNNLEKIVLIFLLKCTNPMLNLVFPL